MDSPDYHLSHERPQVGPTPIVGLVKGIVGNDIVGWVFNRNQSNYPEMIFAEWGQGKKTRFSPHYYRVDIARAFGRRDEENVGFAIPVNAFPEGCEHVIFKDQFGRPLHGGEVFLDRREQSGELPGVCHIFLHIPKTAGTSLRVRLMQLIPHSRQCLLYPFGSTSDVLLLNRVPLHQRQHFSLVMGHTHYGIDRFMGRRCRYFSFVRNPIDRLKSLYWHLRRANVEFVKFNGANVSLEEAINDGLLEQFDNHQVRILAGVRTDSVPISQISDSELNLALFNIENDFDFLGTLENLEEYGEALFAKLNLPYKPLDRQNVHPYSESEKSDERYRRLNFESIKLRNSYDLALYQHVKKNPVL